ncbi:MAG: sulfotransferase [Bacteroidota bacterium]|nr:sulfotransferase [Bacteroidota bacterium]
MKNSTLIITGHPRSGTSFSAALLQSAGLHIGQKLMAPGHGNIRGFFEDLDVVDLHEAILSAQGIHPVGWTLEESIQVDELFRRKANELIANNSTSPVWGWKDPRTTLFLDFWEQLLPEANFLFLYRAPWEVADSIYRRGDEMFKEEPELAIKIWIYYNQKLLQFYDKFPDRCFVASVYNVSHHSAEFINLLNKKFKINLDSPQDSLYEKSLLHTQVSDLHHPQLIQRFYPTAIQIYQELNSRERANGLKPDQSWQQKFQDTTDAIGAFRDWISLRQLERKVKNLQSDLEKAQIQLSSLHNENRISA